MTESEEFPDSLKLEAYLDAQLTQQERDLVARQINASPELQAEVELQQRIDNSLRKAFAPPKAPAELASRLQQSVPARYSPLRVRRRWIAAIAATAAMIVWSFLGWQYFTRDSDEREYDPNIPLQTIYKTRVAEGFKPTWVCSDPREFASTFQARQGQALLLAAMPKGTKMEGLTYCGGLSRYTTTMLARVDGLPVMVFVDRADADTHPAPPPAGTNLHLFRKELGPLVLYEVTPLDHPTVIDYLQLADVPPPT